MIITKSQVAKLFLFIAMVACFSVQSLDSFKKYINQKISFSVSYINKAAEPLPTFSICSEPPFNYEYLKTRNMSSNFFFSSYQLRLLIWSKVCNRVMGHEDRKRHFRRPHFSKGLTKLAILQDYECSGMLCLALPARRKVRKLNFQSKFSIKNHPNLSDFFFIEE